MAKPARFLSGLVLMAGLIPSALADALEEAIQQSLAQNYVTAVLLSDGNNMRFGFYDFDPNEFLQVDDDDLGSEASAERRKRIKTLSLPFEWEFPVPRYQSQLTLAASAAYVGIEREVRLTDSTDTRLDDVDNSMISAALGASWQWFLTPHWTLSAGAKGHWLKFRNSTDYRNPDSQALAPFLDGLVFNLSVKAWLIEPVVGVAYTMDSLGGHWRLSSDWHYLRGAAYDTDIQAHDARPDAEFWTNSLQARFPITSPVIPGQSVVARLARTDLGGDLPQPMGTTHYYEAGVGWVVETGDAVPLLDNIGIGFNFNYGSSLRGGSLLLMFNEY